MPTNNRVEFVLQSIRYFQRQDYPNRELLILDDGTDDLSTRLPEDPKIRYIRLLGRCHTVAKRNYGCELARGTIMVQWDDDDWYGSDRLSTQLAPILAGEAELSGIGPGVLLDLLTWEFWSWTPGLQSNIFPSGVHAGTLAFRRDLWRRLAGYPNIAIGADAVLLHRSLRRGTRLARIEPAGRFIYLRHGNNTWQFSCGRYRDASGWVRETEPIWLASDRAFYLQLHTDMSRSALP
jgi:O-antigen biosynthesis protein